MTPSRVLLCVWLAFHLLTMTVSMAKGTEFAKEVSPYTDPYQWRVGVHQNWTMYAPNPRMNTSWIEFTGIRADGTEQSLPMFVGRPDTDSVIAYYQREGKLERNGISRKHIRAAFVRWYCRTSIEAGDRWQAIRVEKRSVATPRPEKRNGKARAEWPERRRVLETWQCKR